MNKKSLFLKIVSSTLTVLTFVLGFLYLVNLLNDINSQELTFKPVAIVVSIVLFCLFYYLLSIHWRRICRQVDKTVDTQQLSFYASQPYKYLPTSLFTFSFRAKYAKKLGMSLSRSSLAQVIENLNLVGSGLNIGLSAWLISVGFYYAVLLIGVVVLLIFAFVPEEVNLKSLKLPLKINKHNELYNLGIVSVAWVIAGFSFYYINIGIGADITLLTSITSNSFAYTLGIFAFFAPGGIGVREWVYATFSVSGVGIVFWRLFTVLIDFVVGIVAILAIRKRTSTRSR